MKRRNKYNPKRAIDAGVDDTFVGYLLENIAYGGNPEHKRNPGDFGLQLSTDKRADYSLCDFVGILTREAALAALHEGIRRRLVSRQRRGSFPQNVWAVSESGMALEAQLENQDQGAYHGYPMDPEDPFSTDVKLSWIANGQ
jgi:hypothetical protein